MLDWIDLGVIILSQLRSIFELKRNDKKAIKKFLQGVLRWQDLRFITLTNAGKNLMLFKKFVFAMRRRMDTFEYFGVFTGEGGGVVHFVYAGKSVRWSDLRKIWLKISGSWNVHISAVRNFQKIVLELTRQKKVNRYIASRDWSPRNSAQTYLTS